MRFWISIKDWFSTRLDELSAHHVLKRREQEILKTCGCMCKCPECKDPLNDQAECTDEEYVTYQCSKCGTFSIWSFDLAPVPILLAREKEGERISE